MAERRMFAKTIIDSDAFLDMPLSAQSLYFHLSMRADDEGFINNPKKIQRMIGASEDDMKILVAKNFVIPFNSGIVVIKHWRIHNYIRQDRLVETKYKEERQVLKIKDNGAYTIDQNLLMSVTCQSHDGQMTDTCQPNVSIGKDRLGKDSIGKVRIGKDRLGEDRRETTNYQKIIGMYNETCVSFPKVQSITEERKKAIKARLNKYSVEDFQRLFDLAEASDFLKGANNRNWQATFDWLIKDSNMGKVLDGNYNNREKTQAQAPTNKLAQELEESYRMMAQWAAEDDERGTDT